MFIIRRRDSILKLRQYLCKHDFIQIGKHISTSQNLWKCKKCDIYYIQHWGMGVGYKCKTPNLDGWDEGIYNKNK